MLLKNSSYIFYQDNPICSILYKNYYYYSHNDGIYLGDNGITLKGGNNLKTGEFYVFNCEKHYIAKNKDDILEKIKSGFPADRIITTFVADMYGLFEGQKTFNQDISNWDVSNVFRMGKMFNGASSFNQDISNWDVSNCYGYFQMFNGASSFNQDISNWDVSKANNMTGMFNGASSFNQDISNWTVPLLKNVPRDFGKNAHPNFTSVKYPKFG